MLIFTKDEQNELLRLIDDTIVDLIELKGFYLFQNEPNRIAIENRITELLKIQDKIIFHTTKQ